MIQQLQELGIRVRYGQHGNTKTICPKCSQDRKNKHDPCLSVNVDEGVWNCHNCGWAGSVKLKQGKEYTMPPKELKTLSQPVIEWFAARGISNQTLVRYKISEGKEYMPQVGEERNTIHFNYFYNEQLVNIKYRDSAKNFKLVSGARLTPYGIDVALDNSDCELVIVEGEMDVLAFYEAGIKTAVSVPNGASKGNQKLEWLEECWHLFEGKNIYLATDMDEPGQALRAELARRLGKENCYNITLPYKDANDVLIHGGPGTLVECYNSASPFPVEGIDDAASVRDELLNLYEQGYPVGYDIGYDMDFIWHPGQVTLVTGIPGHGKSTWLKNVIYRLAKQYDQKSFIYSAEEANTAFALSDLYSIATGKSFFQSKWCERISKDEVEALMPFMNDHFKYYRLHENDLSIDGILGKAKEMVKRYGINNLVIDNMSTVEKSLSNQEQQRHHQIKAMMNDVARFARNYGVHVFLVAHPKKVSKLKGDKYEVPHGYDVGDSSHWYNLTDNGMTVYRNYETRQTEVHRWKVRFKYSGQVGTSYFTFNINNSRYEVAEKVNDGSDKEKFIGQPYAKKDIETFATLSDPF
jgi:twinkle protein